MRQLNGKVAVVTGAGSGIGRATALALDREGMAVAAVDLDAGAAKETAGAIAGAGGTASSHQVDVSSEEDMRALVDAVLAEHGVVDAVVNVAGIAVAPTPTVDVPLDRFRKVMDVNFWGVAYGSLFFLPHLLERPEANLVNVASNAGIMAYSKVTPYTSSKFAVRGFSESLRMELRPTPVRVTVVYPGTTKTSLMANSPVIENAGTVQRQFEKSWGRPPEAVADAIVRAIRKDRPRALVGPDTAALDAVVRLLPGAYSRLLAGSIDRFMKMTFGPSR